MNIKVQLRAIVAVFCIAWFIPNSGTAQSGVGIDVVNPQEMLDVNGAIRIGTDFNNSNAAPTGGAGTIRWNGTNFQGWDGTQWVNFSGSGFSNTLEDTDGDTKIQVEESPDEDIIRFDVGGSEVFSMRKAGVFPYLQTSSNSVLIGSSISNSITGGYNVAIGLSAGGGLTSGQVNTFVGTNAGGMMTDGHWNVMMGNTAGHFMTNGLGNTVIGGAAGRYRTGGNYNVIMGINAGSNSGAGNNNVMIGFSAGENSTGNNSVFIGSFAGQNETASNRLYIENSNTSSPLIYGEFDNNIVGINGNLGVGTQSPGTKLDVFNGDLQVGRTGNTSGSFIAIRGGKNGGGVPYNGAIANALGRLEFRNTDILSSNTEYTAAAITSENRPGTDDGDLRFYTTSDLVTTEAMNISYDGNVGIGTIADQKLHVIGSIKMVDGNQQAGYVPVSDASGKMTWSDPTTVVGSQAWSLTGNAGTNPSNNFIGTTDSKNLRFLTNNTERMVLSTTGRVGIGTTNPLTPFHVAGITTFGDPTSTAPTFVNLIRSGSAGRIFLGSGGSAPHLVINSQTTNGAIVLTTSSGEVMRARDGGNVGIGTAFPADRLHVAGNIRMVDGNQTAGYIPVSDANGTMTWTDPATITTSADADWTVSGNNQYSSVSGNVGIGTASPTEKLDVRGNAYFEGGLTTKLTIGGARNGGNVPYNTNTGNGHALIDFQNRDVLNSNTNYVSARIESVNRPGSDDGDLRFYTTSDLVLTEAMNIRNNGNVGIGTIGEEKLHVVGSIRMVDGNQQVGYIPVSDANGKMTWTDPTGISGAVNEAVDADGDTRIQVEETADEDIIRFDLAGTEKWVMTASRLEPSNAGNSVFIGANAGSNDDLSANVNVFIGNNAGRDNTTGFNNVAIGASALRSNNSNYNIAIGNAMINSTSAQGTIVLGHNSMPNSNGDYNVVLGTQAGANHTSGTQNIFIGSINVAQANVSGSNNIMMGAGSGQGNTGSQNVFLGVGTGSNNAGSGSVFLGHNAGKNEASSNRLYIENSLSAAPLIYGEFDNDILGINGNLGVGTQAPQDELHVAGSIRMVDGNQQVGYVPVSDANGTMSWTDPTTIATADDGDWSISGNDIYNSNSGNVGIGTTAPNATLQVQVSQTSGLSLPILVRNPSAVNSAGAGSGVGFSNHNAGTSAKAAIYNERVSNYGLGKLHFLMNNTADNTQVSLATDARMTILSNGNIGIGETSPLSKLHVVGNIRMVDGNQQAGYVPVSDANGTMSWVNPTSITTAADGDGDATNELQNLTGATLTGTSLQIDIENGSSATVDLSSLVNDGDWTVSGNNQYSAVSGNVGIGTTTPAHKLQVVGGSISSDDNYFIGNSAGTGTTPFRIDGYANKLYLIAENGADGSAAGTEIRFRTASTNSTAADVMTINNNGNVGIGVTTPTAKLDVKGTSHTGISVDAGNNSVSYIDFKENSTIRANIFWNGSSDVFGINNLGTTTALNPGSGNVGIGTYSPSYKLDVNGEGRFSGTLYIDNNTSILPTVGGNFARIGWSGNAFQDITTRYSYVSTAFSPSDSTLKKDIMPVEQRIDAIQALKNIQPKAFKWNLDKLYWEGAEAVTAADTAWRYGFIAQDIQQVMPETVHKLEENGTLAINFDAIVSVLFEATRKQQEIIEQQAAQLEQVLQRLHELESR